MLLSLLLPFLSLITVSEKLARQYEKFLYSLTGKEKYTNPNNRDGGFNICVTNEDALIVAYKLYYKNCLSIQRKKLSAKSILKWKRPKGMKKVNQRKWNIYENKYIVCHSIEKSMKHLNRTEQSIKMRFWRLKNGKDTI